MLGILLVQITKGCDYDHFNALVPFCRRRDVTSVMCHLLRNVNFKFDLKHNILKHSEPRL